MHLAAKILISVSVSVLAVASAPSAFADPPGVIQVKPPDRHESPGNVEIHVPRDVTFPPQYPDYGAMGIHHHGAAHHK